MRRIKITSFTKIDFKPVYIKGDKSEIKTFKGSLNIDNFKKKKAIELDGFWLLVSNLSDKNDKTSNNNKYKCYKGYLPSKLRSLSSWKN